MAQWAPTLAKKFASVQRNTVIVRQHIPRVLLAYWPRPNLFSRPDPFSPLCASSKESRRSSPPVLDIEKDVLGGPCWAGDSSAGSMGSVAAMATGRVGRTVDAGKEEAGSKEFAGLFFSRFHRASAVIGTTELLEVTVVGIGVAAWPEGGIFASLNARRAGC